jgi:hypothetical protein
LIMPNLTLDQTCGMQNYGKFLCLDKTSRLVNSFPLPSTPSQCSIFMDENGHRRMPPASGRFNFWLDSNFYSFLPQSFSHPTA